MAKLNIGTWVRMKPKDRWRGIHGRIAEIEGDPADPLFTLVLDGSLSFLAARETSHRSLATATAASVVADAP